MVEYKYDLFEADEEMDWNYVLKYLSRSYFEYDSLSFTEKISVSGNSYYGEGYKQGAHFRPTFKFSLLNVALGNKTSTIFSFFCEDKSGMMSVCEELSNCGINVLVGSASVRGLDGYSLSVTATNKTGLSFEQLKEFDDFNKSNIEMGRFLGYPESELNEGAEGFYTPDVFLDISEEEIKKIRFLLEYGVSSKQEAIKALDEAKLRYSDISALNKYEQCNNITSIIDRSVFREDRVYPYYKV